MELWDTLLSPPSIKQAAVSNDEKTFLTYCFVYSSIQSFVRGLLMEGGGEHFWYVTVSATNLRSVFILIAGLVHVES